MAVRDGSVWGRVEWTDLGRQAVAARHYRALSPVFRHAKDGTVVQLLRAGLVNNPNLRGLAALNATREEEDAMSLQQRLAERLGLDPEAGEEAILAALPDRATLAALPALQAAHTAAAQALGIAPGRPQDLAAAVQASAEAAEQLVALQARVEELEEASSRSASERWFDGLAAEGRAGLTAETRELWVARHMEAPEEAQAMAAALPRVQPGRLPLAGATPPAARATSPTPASSAASSSWSCSRARGSRGCWWATPG
jgi:hypothetical protein